MKPPTNHLPLFRTLAFCWAGMLIVTSLIDPSYTDAVLVWVFGIEG